MARSREGAGPAIQGMMIAGFLNMQRMGYAIVKQGNRPDEDDEDDE